MLVSFANANMLIESGVLPEAKTSMPTQATRGGLPAFHDYESGYSEILHDDGSVTMYITQPWGESDIERAFKPKGEGWIYSPGACYCHRKTFPNGSPELRTNDIASYEQIIWLAFGVGNPAKNWNVSSAILSMKYCVGYTGTLYVECWDGMISGDYGNGSSYQVACCGSYNYCNTSAPMPTWDVYTLLDTQTVNTQCMYYEWDVTSVANTWIEQAPYKGYLILYGNGGGAYYQRDRKSVV